MRLAMEMLVGAKHDAGEGGWLGVPDGTAVGRPDGGRRGTGHRWCQAVDLEQQTALQLDVQLGEASDQIQEPWLDTQSVGGCQLYVMFVWC